jgi:hypothetical protein
VDLQYRLVPGKDKVYKPIRAERRGKREYGDCWPVQRNWREVINRVEAVTIGSDLHGTGEALMGSTVMRVTVMACGNALAIRPR